MQPQKVGASVTKKSNLRLDRKMSEFGIITRPITFDFSIFRFSIHVWTPPHSTVKKLLPRHNAPSQGTVFMGIKDSIPSEGGITFS
jgi:hypothetical protein